MCLHQAEESIRNQEFIQIDTTNILFICGGAFDGIEKSSKKELAVSHSALVLILKAKKLIKPIL